MDRFNILLKKPVPNIPKMENDPDHTIRVDLNRHASTSNYDRRSENITIQTLHPVDGDLIIFSLPLAHADDLVMFRDVLETKIQELGVRCQIVVCNC